MSTGTVVSSTYCLFDENTVKNRPQHHHLFRRTTLDLCTVGHSFMSRFSAYKQDVMYCLYCNCTTTERNTQSEHTVFSLSNAARLSFSDLCILLFMFLSLCRLCVCVFLCSHWSLVDVPLIFFCPADHVPDWQPRVLLGMVEARSVNVKKTTTTTTVLHAVSSMKIPLRTVRSTTYSAELTTLD